MSYILYESPGVFRIFVFTEIGDGYIGAFFCKWQMPRHDRFRCPLTAATPGNILPLAGVFINTYSVLPTGHAAASRTLRTTGAGLGWTDRFRSSAGNAGAPRTFRTTGAA